MDEEMLIDTAEMTAEDMPAAAENAAGSGEVPAEESAAAADGEMQQGAGAGDDLETAAGDADADEAVDEEAAAQGADIGAGLDERQQEILRFARQFPEVNPADIDPEILMKWNAGRGSLCDLYAAGDRPRLLEENRRLKEQLAAYEQREKNRETETGSRASAGNAEAMNEIDRIWYGE